MTAARRRRADGEAPGCRDEMRTRHQDDSESAYRGAKVRTLVQTAEQVLGPSGKTPALRLVDDAGREHACQADRLTVDPEGDVVQESSTLAVGAAGMFGAGALVENARPFTSARSIRLSTPSVNASSAPTGSCRPTPSSRAKWLRVPAGTQMSGRWCAARDRGPGRPTLHAPPLRHPISG